MATPALALSGSAQAAAISNASAPTAAVMASARRPASSREQLLTTTANSSPAYRQHTSYERSAPRRHDATSVSASSPFWWPNVSLIALKPLRSIMLKAND